MKNLKNVLENPKLVIVTALAGFAVLFTLVLRDTTTTEAAMQEQAARGIAPYGDGIPAGDAVAYVTSAPYRDGLFEGRLARQRGDGRHVSVGRWSSQLDRNAYTNGYLEGFTGSTDGRSGRVAK